MASEKDTVEDIMQELKDKANYPNVGNDGLVIEISQEEIWNACDRIEAAWRREKNDTADLRRRLKVAEDALVAASDAFRFCIEQCELELGPKMIGKLCDDGKAVERALAAIRREKGEGR